jgi:tetratricopeptide (TPR) repeat protein
MLATNHTPFSRERWIAPETRVILASASVPGVAGMTRRCALACLASLVVLVLGACDKQRSPEVALHEAEARLQADDPAGAERLLREALADAPRDARLRIALARAELAAGNASAAEGSLDRALELGASRDEVAAYLAQALLARGEGQRVLDLVGDVGQWPPPRRLMLALSKAEAALALPSYDQRDLIKSLAEVFRLREAAQAHGAIADLRWVDRRVAELRKGHGAVAAGYEHFACHREQPILQGAPQNALPRGSESVAANRRVLRVGPNQPLHRPSDAARIAQDNDIIEIEAGRYAGDVALWKQNGLLLRGVNGRPHLDSQGRTAQEQGIWVFRGNDIVVENMEFSGARARGRNGSGIRFFGRNLTIRDSYFHHNEDGVLTWSSPQGDILIERCVFAHNGYGDGQSHNVYIGRIRSFTLRFSHSHDSVSGHEVKSRAQFNYITYNRLTDEDDGNSSYLIDLPEGGYGHVLGNILEKGGRSENPNAISFGSERPDAEEGGLWVVNNTFYNRRLDATFVANRSNLPALVVNNVLAGAPVVLRAGPGDDRNNFRSPRAVMIDPAAYDFQPTPDSPLIDAGEDPRTAGEFSLWPEFEYVHPASGRERQRVGALDLGAHEFCGW